MTDEGLAAEIAALPPEERATRYLKVIQDQGLSMATQKRWLDEKDAEIDRLRKALAKLAASARRHINSFHPSSLEGSELNLKNTLDEVAPEC